MVFWINMALLDIYRYKKQGNPWMSNISMERNMLVAEKFLSKNTEMSMANICGINIDGGTCWYPPPTCQFLKLQHHAFIRLWKKHYYRKNETIHKRQNQRMLWLLFSPIQKKREMQTKTWSNGLVFSYIFTINKSVK